MRTDWTKDDDDKRLCGDESSDDRGSRFEPDLK